MKVTTNILLYYATSIIGYNAWAIFGTYVLGHVDVKFRHCYACQIEIAFLTSLLFLLVSAAIFAVSLLVWHRVVARDVPWSLPARTTALTATAYTTLLMLPDILGLPLFPDFVSDSIVLLFPVIAGYFVIHHMKRERNRAARKQ